MPESLPFAGSHGAPGLSAAAPSAQIVHELRALVAAAADYVVRVPAAAETGGWWRSPEPAETVPENPVMRPGEGREAAVLALFCLDGDDPYVLVTERSADLAKHPGQVALPGGAQDDDDAGPAATALREAQEEIGLDPTRVEVIGTLPPAPVPISGFMVTPVIGVTTDPGVLTPRTGEVEAVIRVPLRALVDPANRSTSVLHRGRATHRAPAFVVEGTLIWGFTGILLDRMIARLGWEQPWDWELHVDPRQYQPLL